MQELRLVAVSEDGSYLVLATAGRGTRFTLPVDDRLRAAVRGHFSRLGQFEIEVESPLRPKEIQARIRAGETAEEIAESAGIPVERVRWFEGPVLQEREYMAQQAQRVTVRRQGEATPAPPLGEMVEERLGRRGVDMEEVEWDSWKCEDNTWRVRLSFFDEGRPNAAEWIFDPRRRQVSPLDEEAAALSSQTLDESVTTPVTPLVPRRPAMKIVSDSRPGPVSPRREEAAASRITDPTRRPAVPSRWDQAASADEGIGYARYEDGYGQNGDSASVPEDMGAVAAATGVYVGDDPAPEQSISYASESLGSLNDYSSGYTSEPPTAPDPVHPNEASSRADEVQSSVNSYETAAEVQDSPAPVYEAAAAEAQGAAPSPEPSATAEAPKPGPRPVPAPPRQPATRPAPEAPAPTAPKPAAPTPPKTAAPAPAAAHAPPAPAVEPQQQDAAAASAPPAPTPQEPAAAEPTPAQVAAALPATEPPAAPPARGGRRKAARGKRASVPSWDEIMFGARRPD